MTNLPESVQQRLVLGPSKLAFVEIRGDVIVGVGGAIEAHGLEAVKIGEPVPAEAPWAVTIAAGLPMELRSVRMESTGDRPSDILAWEDGDAIYVMFFDATSTAEVLGATMQRGNADELLRERLAGAERLRRLERRARGEAFKALGYELLEEGPDGGFRPPDEPAHWLVNLCGWQPGEPRVLTPGDPVDYLSAFLEEAVEFFRRGSDPSSTLSLATMSSGVWTQILPESAALGAEKRDLSFQAHALALSDGRGVVAIELKHASLAEMQSSLQRQRDAELSYEGLSHEMQVKDVLLHCIVHDLRGPLSSLVGSFSLLERGGLSEEDERQIIDMGVRQAKRQDEMIKHVLEVFSAEYAALRDFDDDPATSPNVVAIVYEAAQRQKAAYMAKGVDLSVHAPAAPHRIVGRADRLERVLANLIGNALRHAPAGTAVELHVEESTQNTVLVSVLDRGPGVPEELIPMLFRRFVQGGSKGAAGLGLFYVRMTVERWGGEAIYEPRDGGGAVFRVRLQTALPAASGSSVEPG